MKVLPEYLKHSNLLKKFTVKDKQYLWRWNLRSFMKKLINVTKTVRKTVREVYEDLNNLSYAIKGEITIVIAPYSV